MKYRRYRRYKAYSVPRPRFKKTKSMGKQGTNATVSFITFIVFLVSGALMSLPLWYHIVSAPPNTSYGSMLDVLIILFGIVGNVFFFVGLIGLIIDLLPARTTAAVDSSENTQLTHDVQRMRLLMELDNLEKMKGIKRD